MSKQYSNNKKNRRKRKKTRSSYCHASVLYLAICIVEYPIYGYYSLQCGAKNRLQLYEFRWLSWNAYVFSHFCVCANAGDGRILAISTWKHRLFFISTCTWFMDIFLSFISKVSSAFFIIDKLFQQQTNTETKRWKTMRFSRWLRFDAVSFEWKLKKMHKHTFIVEFHWKLLILCLRQAIFGAILLNSVACRFQAQIIGPIQKCLQQQNLELPVMNLNSSLSEYCIHF